MKEIKLDTRLSAAANYVSNGAFLADIGTDHAYLPCYLIQSGKAVCALACDINDLPLKSAEATVKEHNLQKYITLLKCDGLSGIDETTLNSLTDIVICGMGGELISQILEYTQLIRNPRYNIIVQPMTKADYLRKYLCDNGFEIIDETACIAAKKHYTVINARFCGEKTKYDETFLQVGKLLYKTDSAAVEYKKMTAEKLQKAARGILLSNEYSVEAKNMQMTAEKILNGAIK